MYSSFYGNVEVIEKEKIEINVNDVSYEIYMPTSDIDKLNVGEKYKIFTHLQVREDDMRLFGFLSRESRNFFRKLISVSGVGPKVALGIISNISVSDMCIAIATENLLCLKSIPGIGPKMAQKIIFELKDKVLNEQIEDKVKQNVKIANNDNINDAITALQVLGYSEKHIKDVINTIEITEDKVEDIIKKVLKEM